MVANDIQIIRSLTNVRISTLPAAVRVLDSGAIHPGVKNLVSDRCAQTR
jgi:hypothetical protein